MDKVQAFIDAFLDFDETTRSNEGFNDDKFQKVCELLYDLKPQIQKDGCVPLNIANIFVDLYSAIESSAYLHNEEMKQKILHAADDLADIARDITSSELCS